jgi:type 1 fimbria pilin
MNGWTLGRFAVVLLGLFLAPFPGGAAADSPRAPSGRSDDTLRFDVTGAITPSCALVANRIRIDLGNVSVSELPSVGEGSPWRAAAFIGADCVGATHASVIMRAAPAAEDPRYIATAGDARGVAIALRTGSGQLVLPDGTTPVRFDLAGNSPELRFEARYVRVGPLGPGNAPATALVQITWE